MNRPIENLENLFAECVPDVPNDLQKDVAKAVQCKLRMQTLVDDLKWLATSLSILLLVIAVQWIWLRNVDVEMRNLSTMIATTEAGKKFASVRSAFSAVGNNPFLPSESINHFHNH